MALGASGSVTFELPYDALILHAKHQWIFFLFRCTCLCASLHHRLGWILSTLLPGCVRGVWIVLRVLLGVKSVQRQHVFSDDSVGGGLII